MSDASNKAQKMSGNIEGKVREVYIEKLCADAWETLSEEEQGEAVQTTRVYCQNHLRNTCVRHAVKVEPGPHER
jgi:hypothetical protein